MKQNKPCDSSFITCNLLLQKITKAKYSALNDRAALGHRPLGEIPSYFFPQSSRGRIKCAGIGRLSLLTFSNGITSKKQYSLLNQATNKSNTFRKAITHLFLL